MAIQHVSEATKKAKIELSSTQTKVNLPFVGMDVSGPKHINIKLLHSQFESLVNPLVQCTINPCKKSPSNASLKLSDSKDSNKVIAIGTAIQGAVLSGSISNIPLLDITPLSLGIEMLSGIVTKLISYSYHFSSPAHQTAQRHLNMLNW